jgi:4'-phosphopantetheinyl transferase
VWADRPFPSCSARPSTGGVTYSRVVTSAQAWTDPLAQDPALQWAQGPTRPRLSRGATHVWRASATRGGEYLAQIQDSIPLLSDDELARGELISGEQQRSRWLGARAVLRLLLGRYLDRAPHGLRFATGKHGKPRLAPTPTPASGGSRARNGATPLGIGLLHFNLSHSAGTVLYAFSADAPVGVDIEVAKIGRDYPSIARRLFGEAEAERLGGLDRATRELEFLRAWSRHEAELKCLGIGFGVGGFSVASADARPATRGGEPPTWIAELEVAPRAAAVVAVARPPAELLLWDWGW